MDNNEQLLKISYSIHPFMAVLLLRHASSISSTALMPNAAQHNWRQQSCTNLQLLLIMSCHLMPCHPPCEALVLGAAVGILGAVAVGILGAVAVEILGAVAVEILGAVAVGILGALAVEMQAEGIPLRK